MLLSHASRRTSLSVARRSYVSATSIKLGPIQTKFLLPDPADKGTRTKTPPPLTKIVATIGPTSEQLPVLQQVVKEGMRCMRLNFSHATTEEVELRTENLKKCPGLHSSLSDPDLTGGISCGSSNLRAILLDTRGPEIRTGKLKNDHSGHETIHLEAGNFITLVTNAEAAAEGSTVDELYIDYASLHKSLTPGMKVLLDDGAVALTVTSAESEKDYHGKVTCVIDNTGELRSRAGVNLPGAVTELPAMSDKDKVDIKYGMTKDIDYIAASFVQSAEGVHQIRRYVQECAKELNWDAGAPLPLIISKIESMSALQNFDEILEASDGIMVARGDLGVELPIQQVTNAQKEMIAACNAAGKFVIVATQMLESMAKNPRPTRAEVADVTNAVYDGADSVMLSGESAKGKYPVDTVRMMNDIIKSAEGYSKSGGIGCNAVHRPALFEGSKSQSTAIAKAAVAAAEERDAAAIIVLTKDGELAPLVSAYRPDVPIVTFCPSAKVGRQLMLYRGVHPVLGLNGISWSKRPEMAVRQAKEMGFVESGDDVICVTMEDFSEGVEKTATMKIATVP